MVGERIKELRKSKNITQRDLSKQAGISISYIQQLEYGIKENPSLEKLKLIANVLGVNVHELVEENEERAHEDTYALRGSVVDRNFSENEIKEELGYVITNCARILENTELQENQLNSCIEDAYIYIEFILHKLKK